MKIIRIDPNFLPTYPNGITCCIGFFDGVHRGHLELIKHAKKLPYPIAILTFEVGESAIKRHQAYLTSSKDKEEWFIQNHIDEEWIFALDEIKDGSPNWFVDLLKKMNVKEVVVGKDFTFGKEAKGKAEDLITLGDGYFQTHIIDLLTDHGKISSSRIRHEIEEGKIEEANKNLGHTYRIRGIVQKGLHNGTKIGFPTANISLEFPYVLPRSGVYGVRVHYQDKVYPAMANIGVHPTISPLEKPILEIHIFDFNEDIYQEELVIEFIFFHREEHQFASLNDLENELNKNQEEIKRKLLCQNSENFQKPL